MGVVVVGKEGLWQFGGVVAGTISSLHSRAPVLRPCCAPGTWCSVLHSAMPLVMAAQMKAPVASTTVRSYLSPKMPLSGEEAVWTSARQSVSVPN